MTGWVPHPLRAATLPLVLGTTDGLLTVLTLAAGAMLRGDTLGVILALRVGTASAVTAVVTMFVADYAERRSKLLRGSRQLNLSDTRLMATRLGRDVLHESLRMTAVAGTASLLGSAIPILLAASLPLPSWTALVIAEAFIGGLGYALAVVLHTARVRWCLSLLTVGAAVTVLGIVLHIA